MKSITNEKLLFYRLPDLFNLLSFIIYAQIVLLGLK